jgi:uncharacterized protein (TIGR02466 family)
MSTEDQGLEFKRLWPTVILERVVPGHENANRALSRLIQKLEQKHKNLTTDYRGDNLLATEDPAVSWLRECINITVRDYFIHLDMRYDIRWSLQGWANINRFGDYHDYHNHPHAYLSGTYYVQVPSTLERLETRRDVRPGRITFYDPRSSVNMIAIKGDPYVEPEHTITPAPGTILLWPAFVNHFVHPNLSKQPRISVSFNVMLKWSEDYLPAQE